MTFRKSQHSMVVYSVITKQNDSAGLQYLKPEDKKHLEYDSMASVFECMERILTFLGRDFTASEHPSQKGVPS